MTKKRDPRGASRKSPENHHFIDEDEVFFINPNYADIQIPDGSKTSVQRPATPDSPDNRTPQCPPDRDGDQQMNCQATTTIEGVEYPAEIKFPRLDVRAALIRHWLDKSFIEDSFLTGSYVMDPSNLSDDTFSLSIVDLVTPQVWKRLENLSQLVDEDWKPYTTRASVLQGFYEEKFVTTHPNLGKIGLVPKLGMAIAELADCYSKPGISYVDLFAGAATHGLIGHTDLFETPGTGVEGQD